MLSVLAKTTNAQTVGTYALALAITAPAFLLTGLKLRQVQATDARGDHEFGEYLGLRILCSGATVVALVGACSLMNSSASLPVLLLVCLYKAIESVLDIMYGLMQRHEKLGLLGRTMSIRAVLAAVVFGLAVVWSSDLIVALTSLVIVTAIQVPLTVLQIRRLQPVLRPRFDKKSLIKLFRLSLPLGAAVALGSLITNVPRYVLEASASRADLGVFSAIAYCLVATGIITNSLGQAASPRLANLYRDGRVDAFVRLTKQLIAVGFVLGVTGLIAAASIGSWALSLAFGDEYSERWPILVVLMVGAMIQYPTAFVGTAVNALRLFRVQAPLNMFVLVIVCVAALVLIPDSGVMGAAIAVTFGQIATLGGYIFLALRRVRPMLRARSLQPASPLS